ncbi:MAG: S8 family serine peptidase, partial [bacterium]|nr:S8 family serine peptidase [bacterium]
MLKKVVFTLILIVAVASLLFNYNKTPQPKPFPTAEEIQAAKKQLAEMPAPKGVDPVAWSEGKLEFKTPDTLDRVIVRFKKGTSEAAQNEIISRYEGQLLSSFEYSPYSKSILVPEQNRKGLSSDPSVASVESDEPVKMTQDTTQGQTVPWSVSKIGADAAWGKGIKGAGIRVAVIDTGIDIDNPDLRPAIDTSCSVSYFNRYFDNSGNDPMIFASIDSKVNGHGSHVAGVIAARDDGHGVVGVAPEAKLCVIRILDKTGSGSIDATIWGIQQAIKAGVQVINLSVGVIDGTQELKDAVQAAVNEGIVVVAAAGNYEHGTFDAAGNYIHGNLIYPAKYSSNIPGVIAVTAVDNTNYKNPAYKLPDGPEITFAAPGINIRSDCPPEWKNDDGTTVCSDVNVAERTGVASGSSMAAPSVTGQVALLLSRPINPRFDVYTYQPTDDEDNTPPVQAHDGRWHPSEVVEALKASAINPVSGQGKDNQYGYGILLTGLVLKVASNVTFSCTNVPANSVICPSSDTYIIKDTPSSLVNQCSVSVVNCEHKCQTGFRLENGACTPDVITASFSVGGTRETAGANITIPNNGSTNLFWDSANSTECKLIYADALPQTKPWAYLPDPAANAQGSLAVGPLTASMQYKFSCGNTSTTPPLTMEWKIVTVTVAAPAPVPTLYLSLEPIGSDKQVVTPKEYFVGDPIYFYWTSENTASCRFLDVDLPLTGSYYLGVASANDYTVGVRCTDANGA